jgi:hypothetical protein
MTKYLGDFATGRTIHIHFTTHGENGAPIAPSSALAASDFRIYKNGSATERSSTSGVTVTSPFDSVVGRHLVTIDTSNNADPGFFAAGNDYRVEINSSKTIDGVSQSGVEVACFSIQNRTAADVWSGPTRTLTEGVTLTSAERTTLAAAIEAAMIDDGDATALLQAIADKIADENPSLGDLTLSAIASAVWQNSTRSLTAGVTLTSAERTTLVAAIDVGLSASHGEGSWEAAGGVIGEEDLAAIGAAVTDVIGGIRAQVLGAIVFGDGERIAIVQGNDYLERSGNAILLEIERPGVDFTGAAAELAFGKIEGAPLVTVSATVEDAEVGSCKVRVELRKANTSLPSGQYRYDCRIFRPEPGQDDEVITVVDGELVIRPAAGTVTLA